MIVQGDRLAAASCYLPLTRTAQLSKEYGTRHRAALGISEETDAVAVVVSEETGRISVAHRGELIRDLDSNALRNTLYKLMITDLYPKGGSLQMSQRTRLGALRVTAVGLAVLLWLWVTVERRGERPAEKIVDATVTYNPPPGMVILDPQGTVRVRLRGRERAIRRVNPFQIDVQVVVRAEREGPLEVQLTPEDVMMPDGLEVVSIEPSVLRLNVDQEVRRLLPVDVPLVGEPAAGAQLAGKPARRRRPRCWSPDRAGG